MRSKALAKRPQNSESITTHSRDHHSLTSRNPGRRTGTTSLSWERVRQLARDGKGADTLGYRGAFLQLIEKAGGVAK